MVVVVGLDGDIKEICALLGKKKSLKLLISRLFNNIIKCRRWDLNPHTVASVRF
jgi:hypothetical protein